MQANTFRKVLGNFLVVELFACMSPRCRLLVAQSWCTPRAASKSLRSLKGWILIAQRTDGKHVRTCIYCRVATYLLRTSMTAIWWQCIASHVSRTHALRIAGFKSAMLMSPFLKSHEIRHRSTDRDRSRPTRSCHRGVSDAVTNPIQYVDAGFVEVNSALNGRCRPPRI